MSTDQLEITKDHDHAAYYLRHLRDAEGRPVDASPKIIESYITALQQAVQVVSPWV